VLDLVGQLVAKSLVQAETRGGAARYRLLETIRLYAHERLVETGEAATARDRHLAWYLRLVEGAAAGAGGAAYGFPPREGPGAVDVIEVMEGPGGEPDNLRAALAWALEHDPPAGLRLAVGLGWYWAVRHLLPDPGGWLDGLLARAPSPGDLRAQGLALATIVHRTCGALDAARARLGEARAYFTQAGDRLGLAQLDNQEGHLALAGGDSERAGALFRASLAVVRELAPPRAEDVLRNVGLAAIAQGDLAAAREACEESAALERARGARARFAGSRLGVVARLEGDLAHARTIFEDCLTRAPGAWNVGLIALGGLGDLARAEGDFEAARGYYDRLRALLEHRPAAERGLYLSHMGALAVAQGAPERGARLLGAVPPAALAFLRMALPDVAADHQAAAAAARAALGEPAVAAAWAAGRAMSLEEAVAYALEEGGDA
jgi:non-specific serine/threonine protein kinase